jgi:hypothetical protein
VRQVGNATVQLFSASFGRESSSDQSPAINEKPVHHGNSGRSPGGDVASGSGDIGKGAAKGAGNLAAGAGKGATDLATLHPIDGLMLHLNFDAIQAS